VHTDPGGARDVEHGPSVRVYHFAGTEHGTGVWPPTDTQPAPADPHGWVDRSQNLRGVVHYGRLLRACLINLDRWVTDGGAPPPFAKTRHERAASADPRPAVAERYGSRDDYLRRVRAAARVLVEDGYLLEGDVETSLAFAARMWEAWA